MPSDYQALLRVVQNKRDSNVVITAIYINTVFGNKTNCMVLKQGHKKVGTFSVSMFPFLH